MSNVNFLLSICCCQCFNANVKCVKCQCVAVIFCQYVNIVTQVPPIHTITVYVGVVSMIMTYLWHVLQVCSHVAECYRVASQFEKCREMIQEIPAMTKELARILYFKVCVILDYDYISCL